MKEYDVASRGLDRIATEIGRFNILFAKYIDFLKQEQQAVIQDYNNGQWGDH